MTRPKNFQQLSNKLGFFVYDNEREDVPDWLVMENLGFTPTMWKVWKPKFIEKFQNYFFWKNNEKTGTQKKFGVQYEKKSKMWSWFPHPDDYK